LWFRFCLLSLCLLSPAVAKTPRPLVDVPIQTVSGQKINIKQYHAKVVLLVIFSMGCADCIQTLQLMNKLQTDYGSYGFQALAAAGDDNAKMQLGLFIDRYRPTFPVGYMSQDEIIKLCDVPKGMRPYVPISLFIDHTNQVHFQYYGNNAFYQQEEHGMRALIEGLLQQAGAKIQFGEKH
jgi:peroxiredoxin